jgi:hypothetical protein
MGKLRLTVHPCATAEEGVRIGFEEERGRPYYYSYKQNRMVRWR